jgi:hypothetical protein
MSKKKQQNSEDLVEAQEPTPEIAPVSEKQVQISDSLEASEATQAPEVQPPAAEKAVPRFF